MTKIISPSVSKYVNQCGRKWTRCTRKQTYTTLGGLTINQLQLQEFNFPQVQVLKISCGLLVLVQADRHLHYFSCMKDKWRYCTFYWLFPKPCFILHGLTHYWETVVDNFSKFVGAYIEFLGITYPRLSSRTNDEHIYRNNHWFSRMYSIVSTIINQWYSPYINLISSYLADSHPFKTWLSSTTVSRRFVPETTSPSEARLSAGKDMGWSTKIDRKVMKRIWKVHKSSYFRGFKVLTNLRGWCKQCDYETRVVIASHKQKQ